MEPSVLVALVYGVDIFYSGDLPDLIRHRPDLTEVFDDAADKGVRLFANRYFGIEVGVRVLPDVCGPNEAGVEAREIFAKVVNQIRDRAGKLFHGKKAKIGDPQIWIVPVDPNEYDLGIVAEHYGWEEGEDHEYEDLARLFDRARKRADKAKVQAENRERAARPVSEKLREVQEHTMKLSQLGDNVRKAMDEVQAFFLLNYMPAAHALARTEAADEVVNDRDDDAASTGEDDADDAGAEE